MTYKILAINPGSTSTKIAVFENDRELVSETFRHSAGELAPYARITDQYEFRRECIENWLQEHGYTISDLDAVVGRGGLLRPIPGGTYEVTDEMMAELKENKRGEHASNLGGLIAWAIGKQVGIPAYIVDPVVVDEMQPVARVSGSPDLERISIFHALNQKAVARKAAADLGKPYRELNLIVVHLGGGISVGSHSRGKVIDVNNALNGDGPFSPERAGGVPAGQLISLCYSGKYTEEELKKRLVGQGGMVAYLHTNNMLDVEKWYEKGDKEARFYHDAMCYQVCKEIGQCAVVLKGDVDAIIVTGGIAYNPYMVADIKAYVDWIAPVMVYPGEEELSALAAGAYRVLSGEEAANSY
ncbi:butyrate kinase [bacterium]|nr:butyrate kinase [bacterium]